MNQLRRRTLLATTGIALSMGGLQRALAAGRIPLMQGMNRIRGEVSINGRPAAVGQLVTLGDTIVVGAGGEAVYVIGDNAFLQGSRSQVRVEGTSTAKLAMRLLSGALASVFAKGEHQVASPTATVGIRGTAAFLNVMPERTYFCLCYGRATLNTTGRPDVTTELVTRHHDRPYYIGPDGALQPAPVIDHTDAQLIMLEALVGREPPFVVGGHSVYR